MGGYLLNSLLVASAITVLSLSFNLMAGYAFAKLRFAGRERLFQLLIGALVIPAQVAMLPLFLLLKYLGLVNSYAGVVVPGMATVFGIFLVRQYARGIPDELMEAARIDGAGEWRIFLQIVMPLLKPIMVTLAIFTFLAAWNDFMWPLIVLTGQEHYTLPIGLASLAREHSQDSELMMAGSVVTVLPVLVLFLAMQRYYLEGLLCAPCDLATHMPLHPVDGEWLGLLAEPPRRLVLVPASAPFPVARADEGAPGKRPASAHPV
ncbi:MAG: hypothetical protein WDW38_009579 [Sanguina aurantia]